MPASRKSLLAVLPILTLAACGVDSKYSDLREGAENGFPELALQLGAVREDCVLQPEDWEKVFIANNITTSRRVSNALNGMQQNGQIIFFPEQRVLAVTSAFCAA